MTPNSLRLKTLGFSTAVFFMLLSSAPLAEAKINCPVPRKPVASQADAKSLAKQLTGSYRLTTVSVNCLDFNLDREAKGPAYEIDVHEIHSEQCGGVIGLSPRVFSMKILPDGHVTTDAKRIDGEYKPLHCPGKANTKK